MQRSRIAGPAAAVGLVLTLALWLACGGDDKRSAAGETSDSRQGRPVGHGQRHQPRRRATRSPTAGRCTGRSPRCPPNFNYHQVDGTLSDNADDRRRGHASPFVFDAQGRRHPELKTDYVDSAELTSTRPEAGRHLQAQPEGDLVATARRSPWPTSRPSGRPTTAPTRAYKVSSTTGYDQIESVVKGADEREVVVTFKRALRRLAGRCSAPLYPASTNTDPKVFNEGWVDEAPRHGRAVQVRGHRPDGQDHHHRPRRQVVGRPAKLDRIIYRAIDADAAGRRPRQRRDRLHRHRPRRRTSSSGPRRPPASRSAGRPARTSVTSPSTAPARC